MALMFVSCSKDEEKGLTHGDISIGSAIKETTLSASIEDDSPSRVNYTSAVSPFWTEDDKIAVYNTEGSFSQFTISSGAGSTEAEFTGSLSGSTSTCAVYPASAAKDLSDNTLTFTLPASYTFTSLPTDFPDAGAAASNSADVPMVAMIAEEGDTDLTFRNLGGMFCFKFYCVPNTTCKIVFTTDKQINGDFSVDLAAATPTIDAVATATGDSKSVTLEFPALTCPSRAAICIPVPCGEYQGFKIGMYDSSGRVTSLMLNAKTHNIERGKAITFDDSQINPYGDKVSDSVNLGLSVSWAPCNIGATNSSDCGEFYAWGETASKGTFIEENCLTCNKTLDELRTAGIIDADDNLTPAYDAATANWGGNWRMPTKAEVQELMEKCTWTLETVDGVTGYRVSLPEFG